MPWGDRKHHSFYLNVYILKLLGHMSDTQEQGQHKSLKQKLIAWTDRYFPERQLVLRTEEKIRYFYITKAFQLSVTATALVALTWGGYATVANLSHDSALQAKDDEIHNVQIAYRSLISEINDYQAKFSTLSHEIEENHSRFVASFDQEQAANKTDKEGASAASARREAAIARNHLNKQLHAIEESMQALSHRNYSLKGDLSSKEMDLQTAIAERNTAQLQKKRLEERLSSVEEEMARLALTQDSLINQVTDQTSVEIQEIEAIMTIAGLDPNAMLQQLSSQDQSASGGPFIAAKEEGTAERSSEQQKIDAAERQLDRWQRLQKIKQSMPLAEPIDFYYISSRYGKRRDPVNKRWAMHYGLDMAASIKTPIYVSAPGTVTFVGWKGNYGQFIEVDHGNGIKTRYGHLHKTLVKKGETVDYRSKIALVGNTGRSTGAHLHYEIKVNGKNVNPYNFIKAGRNVFQG